MRPPLATCSVCEELFDPEGVIEIAGCVTCAECKPVLIARFQQGTMRSDHTVARDGSFLVVGRQSLLPGRCVKCNKPAGHYQEARVYGQRPLLGKFLTTTQVVTLEVGLCEAHLKRRRRALIVSWTLVVLWLPLYAVFSLFDQLGVVSFGLASAGIWVACCI